MKNGVETDKAASAPIKPPGPPKVWAVVESVKRNEQEKPIKFSIQEIPEDRYEDVLEHMITYFIADEPVCNSVRIERILLDGKNDPLFVQDFRVIWRDILKQGVSVGAFVENPDGGKPIIAGVNLLGVDFKERQDEFKNVKFLSPISENVMAVILNLSKQALVYEKYGVDKYMYALGLSVNPRFRGEALGYHILKSRENIGREYKIPVTSTAFTSPISQKLAERAGFEVLLERDYDQIFDHEGKPAFPNIGVKTFKIMGRRLY